MRDPYSGVIMRTGRTIDFARRAAEHARNPALHSFEFEPFHYTEDYAAQRGLEHILHETYMPRFNKIRPVSLANPKLETYLDAAQAFNAGW